MNLSEELKKLIQGDVIADEKTLSDYSHDYSIFNVRPETVVFPKDKEDVEKLVQFAEVKKKAGEKISVTGRSAGTDMSGGPLNESVIVEFTKYFNHIREINEKEKYVIVEPGVYFRDLEKQLQAKHLLYPAYPASKDLCALGGMVNNNSGGELTLQYGKTENFVEGLHIVLADGKEHYLEPLSGEKLEAKLKEQGFEGDVYRKLYQLINDNYETIIAAKPKVSKNSAGYYLWNVWDKKTFDITKVIVGSQGTFGLLTAARLRLVPAPKYTRLVVIFSKTLDPVPDLVNDLLALKPESIESYDDKTMGLAIRFFPTLMRLMKGSLFKLIFEFIPEIGMLLRSGGMPKMILLVSVTADDEKELERKAQEIVAAATKYKLLVRNVKSDAESEEYWTIRRQSFALIHSHVKGMDAAAFIDDIIVEPKYMPEILPQVNAILDKYKDKLVYTIAGHPGNGNFHIIPLVHMDDPETRKIIPEVTEQVYQLIFKYGGSITAEHNDGIIRTPYLKEMYGEKIVSLFMEAKKIFDPDGIFNPGKKVGDTLQYAARHMKS
ncbi:FAD-binding oxidoreductase [Patescibacteria group bacterium]|nr:FAD-binding oxidoreductase [Patescibacteria group bacterium]MCL5114433.1 FAD-binding oxidoreductase [Patescibacteria group bacterium]